MPGASPSGWVSEVKLPSTPPSAWTMPKVWPMAGTKFAEILPTLRVSTGASVFGATANSSLFQVRATAGETIGREVLHYDFSPVLALQGGGEVAYNFRKQQVALVSNGAPVSLSASNVRVEEVRGDAVTLLDLVTLHRLQLEGWHIDQNVALLDALRGYLPEPLKIGTELDEPHAGRDVQSL